MEVFAILSITSSKMTADEIRAKIALQCDKCWAAGDYRENTTIREKLNGWKIICQTEVVDDVGVVIEQLLGRISGREEAIAAIADSCNVLVRCAIYSEGVPPLYFSDHILQGLARIKASFDLDLYVGRGPA